MSWDDDYGYDDYDHDDDYGDYDHDDYGYDDEREEFFDDLDEDADSLDEEEIRELLDEVDEDELEDLDEEEVEELLNENHSIEEIEEELIDREEEVLHGIRIEQTVRRHGVLGLFGLTEKVQVMHCPYCLTNKVHTERPGEWFCDTCQDVFLEEIK